MVLANTTTPVQKGGQDRGKGVVEQVPGCGDAVWSLKLWSRESFHREEAASSEGLGRYAGQT